MHRISVPTRAPWHLVSSRPLTTAYVPGAAAPAVAIETCETDEKELSARTTTRWLMLAEPRSFGKRVQPTPEASATLAHPLGERKHARRA
jgi:hypothetical protein